MGSSSNEEIERKFLVRTDAWRSLATGRRMRQGYLGSSQEALVRVRSTGDTGFLTIKGAHAGITRREYEYEIPVADAEDMLATLCGGRVVEKTRYRIPHDGMLWEVDEFHGANEGLVTAEIELDQEDQHFAKPDWIGEEVSLDPRYANAALAVRPYSEWSL